MTVEKRTKGKLASPGPFLAEITNHLDPSYMGGVEVVLIQSVTNPVKRQDGTFIVRYLSPFYGATSVRHEGNDPNNFNDVQKSYGMWMVPPDIGTMVMVIFIDGDPNQGYWMGCVQDTYQNHMVPGLAASKYLAASPAQKQKYGTDYLPVGEFNKRRATPARNPSYELKPIHPFADRLLEQGLILDNVRGVTSSSARREVPSQVFGISTPGPLDPNGKMAEIGYEVKKRAPVSRLGGSSFVMDDGDINGDNELVRIRTRTGHQILMHNTKDLIYIANSKGTAWIELTSNGKIDIYAKDSVSIHTEEDFNFKADKNINFEAGGNINMSAVGSATLQTGGNLSLIAGATGFITVVNKLEISSSGNNLTSSGDTNIRSGGQHLESASKIHMNGPAAAPAESAESLTMVVTRAPTHEPWADHEDKGK